MSIPGPIDQRKVVQVADTLKQGFPGAEVRNSYSDERLSQFYRIDRDGALAHRIYVSKEFLEDHTPVQIDQLLQSLGAVDRIRDAGTRVVTINNHGIQTASE